VGFVPRWFFLWEGSFSGELREEAAGKQLLQTPQSWSAIFAGTKQVIPGGTGDPPVLGGNLPPSQAHDNC
jgi:hypothetical protein